MSDLTIAYQRVLRTIDLGTAAEESYVEIDVTFKELEDTIETIKASRNPGKITLTAEASSDTGYSNNEVCLDVYFTYYEDETKEEAAARIEKEQDWEKEKKKRARKAAEEELNLLEARMKELKKILGD